MKLGDLVMMRDGFGSSSYASLPVQGESARCNGSYFASDQSAIIINFEEGEPHPGFCKFVFLLGPNGCGWLPERFIQAIS